jgi:hypothetical protein
MEMELSSDLAMRTSVPCIRRKIVLSVDELRQPSRQSVL